MNYKAVIFDYDDTLVETWRIKWAHHKAVAKRYYNIDLSDDTLAHHWGKPFPQLVGILYQQADSVKNTIARLDETEAEFLKVIQPETLKTLERLAAAGLPLGIVTSMTHDYTVTDMRRLGLPVEAFQFIQGADDSTYHKPDPRVFEPAVKAFGPDLQPDQIVYVGDALIDYSAARAAGLGFIGVTTGRDSITDFATLAASTVIDLPEASILILKQ